jgi:hypothetical protein
MAKQGQHNNDDRDQDKSRGHNNPSKSMAITAGTPKKRETYAKQAREHKDPGVQAQAAENDWQKSPIDTATRHPGSTRARNPRSGRSGSDSDATS